MRLIGVVFTLVLSVPLAAGAQQGAKTKLVGVLSLASPDTSAHLVKAASDAFRALGWVQGQNITFVSRFAYGRLDRVPELAAELVRSNVDVIWTGGRSQLQEASGKDRDEACGLPS